MWPASAKERRTRFPQPWGGRWRTSRCWEAPLPHCELPHGLGVRAPSRALAAAQLPASVKWTGFGCRKVTATTGSRSTPSLPSLRLLLVPLRAVPSSAAGRLVRSREQTRFKFMPLNTHRTSAVNQAPGGVLRDFPRLFHPHRRKTDRERPTCSHGKIQYLPQAVPGAVLAAPVRNKPLNLTGRARDAFTVEAALESGLGGVELRQMGSFDCAAGNSVSEDSEAHVGNTWKERRRREGAGAAGPGAGAWSGRGRRSGPTRRFLLLPRRSEGGWRWVGSVTADRPAPRGQGLLRPPGHPRCPAQCPARSGHWVSTC